MKKFGIFLVIWVLLISLVYLVHSDEQIDNINSNDVKEQITHLTKKYDLRLFKAYYSIDELRPFSIVQIDKVIEMYNQDISWQSPAKIVKKLTEKDKEKLTKSVIEYIQSFEPAKRKSQVLTKLEHWCKADAQFEFINSELGIVNENIIESMHNLNISKGIASKYHDLKSAPKEGLSDEQKEYAYYQTLNIISVMKFSDQLKYYSELYNSLANICVN